MVTAGSGATLTSVWTTPWTLASSREADHDAMTASMSAAVSGWWERVQDRWSTVIGCPPEGRPELVAGMMRSGPSETAGYWLQLALATGIATMGLVLDSGAVVIAAMLVAPLMLPIESLGMGLAVGSPLLVVRSSTRVLLSVALAVGASALVVRMLPFQAVSAEIVARTQPTALDLVTAAFCALAGSYAAVRTSSDVASTAAGTSIGISLVPPLCVCGYGVGTSDVHIASGAAMLFVTNLVAIVVVGASAFTLLGFHRIDARGLELEALSVGDASSRIGRIARWVARRIQPRAGLWLRLAMPLALLAMVYVPLRAALDEVAWQVRFRGRIETLIAALGDSVVDSSIRIERRTIGVAVVMIGTTASATAAREQLDATIREVAHETPRLTVVAVPDAAAVAGLADELRRAPPLPQVAAVEPVAPPPPPTAGERLDDALELVDGSVRRHWPELSLGVLLAIRLERVDEGIVISTLHQGPPLDAATLELLERDFSEELGHDVRVEDLELPSDPLEGEPAKLAADLVRFSDRARLLPGMWICVQVPRERPPRGRARTKVPDPSGTMLREMIRSHPRVGWSDGERWSIRFVRGGCDETAASAPRP